MILASTGAVAEPQVSSTQIEPSQTNQITPWRIYGGISTGLGKVSGQDYRSAPGGGLVGLSLLASYEAPSWAPRWVADAGIGWMYSNVNGQDSTGRDIRIRTRSATAEISPRYRLGEFWQVGPALEMLFGADTGFGPSVGNSFGSAYAGLRVVYETRSAQLPLRFLVQGLTDLNVPNRQVNLVTAGFQIGIPIRVSSNASQKIVKTDVLSESRSAPIRLVLDPQSVFFGTNSSQLRAPILEALGEIGEYLSSNSDQWGRVEVSGHADQRGSYQYNLKLSRRRAASVKSALGSSESVQSRIESDGFSFNKLKDSANNQMAWAKNRRVEVVFYDVRDPQKLIELIKKLPLGSVAQGELK